MSDCGVVWTRDVQPTGIVWNRTVPMRLIPNREQFEYEVGGQTVQQAVQPLHHSHTWTSPTAPGLPVPLRLTPLRAGDTDRRSFLWELPPGDQLMSVDQVTVRRRDNRPYGSGDLTAAPTAQPEVIGSFVSIWLVSDPDLLTRGSIDYQVTVVVSTEIGRQLFRDFFVSVVAPLGPPITTVRPIRPLIEQPRQRLALAAPMATVLR